MTSPRHRRVTVLLCVLSGLAGVWLGWNASSFIAQDRCLDAGGGEWDPKRRLCVFARSD